MTIDPSSGLRRRILAHEAELARYLARQAGPGILRYESIEDLLQGVYVEALKSADSFEDRGEPELLAWLYRVAQHHIYHRAAHWSAAKREGDGVLRLIAETGGLDPPASGTSPSSFAGRREQLVLVTRALAALPEKDREILRLSFDGASIEDLAVRTGTNYEAAKRARLRALDRLRKTCRLMARPGGPPG